MKGNTGVAKEELSKAGGPSPSLAPPRPCTCEALALTCALALVLAPGTRARKC